MYFWTSGDGSVFQLQLFSLVGFFRGQPGVFCLSFVLPLDLTQTPEDEWSRLQTSICCFSIEADLTTCLPSECHQMYLMLSNQHLDGPSCEVLTSAHYHYVSIEKS
ncbi:hypothetical protein AMECASPLE_035838 [Ameca splendens]|uniref:Uncharacterized protein n=1 Tax=Ameca splendens TaxID=208324 RepID=A0ABV0YVV2_9TELE